MGHSFFNFGVHEWSHVTSLVKLSINNFLEDAGMYRYGRAVGGNVRSGDFWYSCVSTILYVLWDIWVFGEEVVFDEQL